ncbi:hypothetical protein QC823_15585 [Halomonas vilamensis]|uniref:Uncharacterized protein n=1 Tax=Vreelandella vilamensis TaxID=531309 RepID=A0ABU1H9R1_9GAMM|nr:hypothetical protein [Halomonas vilamensis]MDR5900387.1 hypothetical protein [Halomonas vilamensis]
MYTSLSKIAFIITSLLISSGVLAQQIAASTDNFNYFDCDVDLSNEEIKRLHILMKKVVDLHNSQENVDALMETPSVSHCYKSVGKEGTIFAGIESTMFYIDNSHFQCSLSGTCQGAREGYIASFAVISASEIEITASTRKVDDMVKVCLGKEGLNYGSCS